MMTYPSLKLFYGNFDTCFRFYIPVLCKTLMNHKNENFWDRKVRLGDEYIFCMENFQSEENIKKIVFKTCEEHFDNEHVFHIITTAIFFHMVCRFYDKTGKDLFDCKNFQWRNELMSRYRVPYWKRKVLVSLFGQFSDIKLFFRIFVPESQEVVNRMFPVINKDLSEPIESEFEFIIPKSFSLPCSNTYTRKDSLKVSFEPTLEENKILLRITKKGGTNMSYVVDSYKKLFELVIKHSESKIQIVLPYSENEKEYYKNRKQEIEQLMTK